jgi:hypothetical protein
MCWRQCVHWIIRQEKIQKKIIKLWQYIRIQKFEYNKQEELKNDEIFGGVSRDKQGRTVVVTVICVVVTNSTMQDTWEGNCPSSGQYIFYIYGALSFVSRSKSNLSQPNQLKLGPYWPNAVRPDGWDYYSGTFNVTGCTVGCVCTQQV